MPATFPRCNHFRILDAPERQSEYLRCTQFDFPESSFRKYISTKITSKTQKNIYINETQRNTNWSRREIRKVSRSNFTGDETDDRCHIGGTIDI